MQILAVKCPLLYIFRMIKAEISDDGLICHLDSIERDGMTVFVMADGKYRGAVLNGTRLVNQMRANHHLGILETMILGQAELCAALMIPTMKGREHLSFRYDTNGPAAGFSVEADSAGSVRGFLLQNSIPVEKPLDSWDLSPFFGPGTVTVSRLGEGMKQPQTGTVEIVYRNIAQDLAWYFLQSEQINTAFNTGIQFDKNGMAIGAGGLFLQRMPSTGGYSESQSALDDEDDKLDDRVEAAFSASPSYGQWFSEKGTREDIIYGLFREFKPQAVFDRNIVFDCPCSYEKYCNHIKNINPSELKDILEHDNDPIEVVCHNCGSVYKISKKDLQ